MATQLSPQLDRHHDLMTEMLLQEMAVRIAGMLPHDGSVDPLPGVRLNRHSKLSEEVYGEAKPAFCVVAQGAKEIFLAGKKYRYDTRHYLLSTVEMPLSSIILSPSEEEPFLSLRFELDSALIGSVMMEAGLVAPTSTQDTKALGVSPLDFGLLEAAARLLRLLAEPAKIPLLLPLLQKEIVYRLLLGEHGHRLRHLPSPTGHTTRIAKALERLRQDFDQPLRIDLLAKEVGMSSTRFHHHFKSVTDMSPLQFQKQLRLQEARRLMLSDEVGAAVAGHRVGYEDASHFSRDYKKHFGYSPLQDIERLHAALSAS